MENNPQPFWLRSTNTAARFCVENTEDEMGTNYYLIEAVCAHCKRGSGRLHIGKSSAGWCFGLHVDQDEGLGDLAAWRMRWSQPDAKIVDEYGRDVTAEEMEQTITRRSFKGAGWDDTSLSTNHATRGPAGLARHQIDGRHCVGHGESTYDLLTGEFS
jgi:hypothetical protein